MQPKKLEQYKYFPQVAWTVCLVFAGYVGMLAIQLDDEIERLENSSLSFENRLQNIERALATTTPSQKTNTR